MSEPIEVLLTWLDEQLTDVTLGVVQSGFDTETTLIKIVIGPYRSPRWIRVRESASRNHTGEELIDVLRQVEGGWRERLETHPIIVYSEAGVLRTELDVSLEGESRCLGERVLLPSLRTPALRLTTPQSCDLSTHRL